MSEGFGLTEYSNNESCKFDLLLELNNFSAKFNAGITNVKDLEFCKSILSPLSKTSYSSNCDYNYAINSQNLSHCEFVKDLNKRAECRDSIKENFKYQLN